MITNRDRLIAFILTLVILALIMTGCAAPDDDWDDDDRYEERDDGDRYEDDDDEWEDD